MFFLALLLPGVYFLITGRIIRGIISLILMATLFGWIIASIWAVMYRSDKIRKGELENIKKGVDKNTSTDEGLGSTAVRAAGAAAIASGISKDTVAEDETEEIENEEEEDDDDDDDD